MESIECKVMEEETLLEEESEPLITSSDVQIFFVRRGIQALIIQNPTHPSSDVLESKAFSIIHKGIPSNLIQALLSPTTYLIAFKMVDDSNKSHPHTLMVLPECVVIHSNYLMRILARDFREEYERFDIKTRTFTNQVDKPGLGTYLLPISLDKDIIQTSFYLREIHNTLLYYYERFHDDLESGDIRLLKEFVSNPKYVDFINYLGFDMRIKEISEL